MNITSLSSGWSAAGGGDAMSGASAYVSAADAGAVLARHSVQQQSQNFKSLSSAIQTGDLAGARSAYATLQQQIQTASQSAGGVSLFDANRSIGRHFQAVGTALQTGDLGGAQSALAAFKQGISAARRGTDADDGTSPGSAGADKDAGSNAGSLNAVA